MQVEAGGIAQVVGMAESFAGDDELVVCLGDNIFEYAEADAIRSFVEGDDGAAVFVKEVPDPERFGVVVYGDDGRVMDVVEKAGVVDLRYASPPSNDAVVGLYCYSPDVFDVIRGLRPSSRGELEITDVNRHYAERGSLACHRVTGWWEDAGHAGVAARDRRPDRPHRCEQVRRDRGDRCGSRCAASRTSAAGSGAPARERCCRSRRGRRTSRSRAEA